MDEVDLECEDNVSATLDVIPPLRRLNWWRIPQLLWFRQDSLRQNSIKKSARKQQSTFEYAKRAGTTGVSGQLYETKLLCLILLRALNDKHIENFLLGTNIRDIGDMDDICLRYRLKDRKKPIALFIQAKHRDDRERRLTVDDIRNVKGGFSLRKYFETYLTIQDRFRADNKDPMFEGNFGDIECNLVIYTPAKDCFAKKNTEHQVSEKVHYLINTGDNDNIVKYHYDDDDIENLTKMTVIERIKKLGAVFVEVIMSEKEKSQKILMDTRIARYHVVMGREVLQPCKVQEVKKEHRMWEFRPQFFNSDCEYLMALKWTFVSQLSTNCWNQSKITKDDLENYKLVLRSPCAATISKLIGKIVIYNEKTRKLQLTAQVTANIKKIKADEFKASLGQLDEIEISEDVITEAIELKLKTLKIKLPLAFGNLDMTFRGNETKVRRRMKAVANKLIDLFKLHKKIVDINDDFVGPGKMIEQGIIDINGGIGGAVGNLFVFDSDTKMLKFDFDNKALPLNAALFLKVLKENIPYNEELNSYRFRININGFPKDSFSGDEYDKRQAKDFFNKLWFYTNQANENEIESIINNEINDNYEPYGNKFKFKINSYAIFLKVHDDVQKWWKQSNKAPYMTRSNDLFLRAMFAYHGHRMIGRRCSSCH